MRRNRERILKQIVDKKTNQSGKADASIDPIAYVGHQLTSVFDQPIPQSAPGEREKRISALEALLDQYKDNDKAHWYMHIKVHSIMADPGLTWQTKGKMALKIYDELKKSIEPKTETQVAK